MSKPEVVMCAYDPKSTVAQARRTNHGSSRVLGVRVERKTNVNQGRGFLQ